MEQVLLSVSCAVMKTAHLGAVTMLYLHAIFCLDGQMKSFLTSVISCFLSENYFPTRRVV
jgi:hypothetical protein